MTKVEFIESIAPIIQKYAKQYGYRVCSPIIAQACCESNFGLSSLWSKYYNAFGMKCGSSWKGASVNLKTKEEYTVGVLTTIKDNFRAYSDADSGIKGYFEFISAKRYANLKDASTPEQYLQYIKNDGYATSSTYVNTNMNIVKTYNLIKYDSFEGTVPNHIASRRTLKKGMSGSDVIVLQKRLAELGYYSGKVDGIYGNGTAKAVLCLQYDKFVDKQSEWDAKCGPKTWALIE